jgi:hypothetical protein
MNLNWVNDSSLRHIRRWLQTPLGEILEELAVLQLQQHSP